jgi:uncharacterized protein (TIGR00369 family)
MSMFADALAPLRSVTGAFDLNAPNRNVIRDAWDLLSRAPGGKRLFSRFVGRAARYSGTIGAQVVELRKGYARVEMADRAAVRNHLKSVHAVALVNLAEMAGNLALSYSLPDDARFIVAGLSIDYVKKARGPIAAESTPPAITTSEKREYPVTVTMRDAQGEVVATCSLRTLVGPKPKS